MSHRLRLALALPFALGGLLLLGACGDAPDDDDATADDDDSASDDDDATADDDDATVDDDDDATGGAPDYVDAVIPDYPDCVGNSVLFSLGDGTELGPFDGFFEAPTSFANNFGQFTIRVGTDDAWTALNGHYDGMDTSGPIEFEGPSSQPGNVVLQALLTPEVTGGGPEDLAGNFGAPPSNLSPEVGGSVTFGAVPSPGGTSLGVYSGIIQKFQSVGVEQVVLLGVSGCFNATLQATDG